MRLLLLALFLLVGCSNPTAIVTKIKVVDKITYDGTVVACEPICRNMEITRYFVSDGSNNYFVGKEIYDSLELGKSYTVVIVEGQDTIIGVQ